MDYESFQQHYSMDHLDDTLSAFHGKADLASLNQSAEQGSWHSLWLDHTLGELPVISSAILAVLDSTSGRLKPAAANLVMESHTELLSDIIDESAYCEAPIVTPLDQGEGAYAIAYPIVMDEQVQAVFSCAIQLNAASEIDEFMGRLEWLCFWIDSHYLKQSSDSRQALIERQRAALDGYQVISQAENWHEASLHWSDTLRSRFECERVSLGWVRNASVKLEVISGSSDHDLKSASARKIRLAMQECYDQRKRVSWPVEDDSTSQVSHNTEKLSTSHHNARILSVPLQSAADDSIYAVLVLERTTERAFSAQEISFIESVSALVGLTLKEKFDAQVSLASHSWNSLKQQLERLLSPGYLKRKLFAIALVVLILFFSLARGDYRVNADAVLEPELIRIVSAPFNGYIKSAAVRAGDELVQGKVLVAMEDRDLRLEKIKWLSQIEQDKKKYTESIASYERSQAQILFAKIAQSQAQLAVTESQLQRAVIKAPFDALIVSGDLSKRVGGSVKQGEELFRISPMNNYRLILYVSEYKIRDLQEGQQGHVVLSSLPNQSFDFEVIKITPITEVRDGGTFFRVEAQIDERALGFRPGLVGIGKVSIDERLLIDIWTHDLRHWLRMKLWSFWG
ncbi:MAG: efflux RND transporter periplasmic adaptor subunit [Pseudomonadota bacterium]|nr:efflux RND transporter periplasmic adaptor subunit [Pseudomonadota bacterium]